MSGKPTGQNTEQGHFDAGQDTMRDQTKEKELITGRKSSCFTNMEPEKGTPLCVQALN